MTRGLAIILAGCVVALLMAAPASPHRGESAYEKARRIVYAVFPDSTQAAALRVVHCETGGTFNEWASNSEGASGYFQVLQGNAGRVLYYRGRRLVIPSGTRLFLPWTNARVALFLSKGGTDWTEWVCKP